MRISDGRLLTCFLAIWTVPCEVCAVVVDVYAVIVVVCAVIVVVCAAVVTVCAVVVAVCAMVVAVCAVVMDERMAVISLLSPSSSLRDWPKLEPSK